MGDMCDWIIRQDPYEEVGGYERPISFKVCHYCGQDNLVWVAIKDGAWRLGNLHTKQVHKCSFFNKRK
jgi:hypothetical protein